MTDSDEAKLPATWSAVVKSLTEGGLPQIIAGPAGKAISRLVAGMTDIPAAWLERKAQSISDETQARSLIVKKVANEAASIASKNSDITQRALERYVYELTSKQGTREAIARKTIELLVEEPPTTESDGPSDDWLNLFSEYAERASSEHLQDIWARVLAGEIRRPASVSLRSLQFISLLDQHTARAAEVLLGRVFDGQYALIGNPSGSDYLQMNVARSAGLVSQLASDTTTTTVVGPLEFVAYSFGAEAVVVRASAGTEISLRCTVLTPVGMELTSIVKAPPSEEAINLLVDMIKTQGNIRRIDRGRLPNLGSIELITELRKVWPVEGAASTAL